MTKKIESTSEVLERLSQALDRLHAEGLPGDTRYSKIEYRENGDQFQVSETPQGREAA